MFINFSQTKYGFLLVSFSQNFAWHLNFGARSIWASAVPVTCSLIQASVLVSSAFFCLAMLSDSKRGTGNHGKEPVIKTLTHFPRCLASPWGIDPFIYFPNGFSVCEGILLLIGCCLGAEEHGSECELLGNGLSLL